MQISSGTRLGHYEIATSLGAGGMGEVYRARDTKLGREVAIKVLLESLAEDADRLARFEREARVLASLNHPNVAVLHGFESESLADGSTRTIAFLVMELVDGETLGQRIGHSGLPWREAIGIFEQIAAGLKAAHESGIVHRDLKPANVKVAVNGRVKVLDFGLARAATPPGINADATQSPTLTAMTGVGTLLGTAAYMAPEQARGLNADRRADIWAFGACLFETLTGKRLFAREDVALTLAAVLSQEIDLSPLPADTPGPLRELLERCLDRDPERRLQDLGDARWLLGRALEPAPAESQSSSTPARSPIRNWGPAILALALGLAAGAYLLRPAADPVAAREAAPTLRFVTQIAESVVPARIGREVAVHPSGTAFAYVGNGAAGEGIYLHDLIQSRSRFINGSEGGKAPFFASDGLHLGFERGNGLYQVPVEGGLPQLLFSIDNLGGFLVGVSWRDDTLLLGFVGRGIWKVKLPGGEPELVPGESLLLAGFPEILPDGEHFLYTVFEGDTAGIARIDSGEVVDLDNPIPGSAAQYLDSGHLVVALEDNLGVVPFDVESLRMTGSAVPIQPQPRTGRFNASFAVSSSGTLIATDAGQSRLVSIDARGTRHDLGAQPGHIRHPRVSRDGRYVAYTRGGVGAAQVWVREIDSGRELRLTEENAVFPVWKHDGRVLFFHPVGAVGGSIDIMPPDRSVPPESLLGIDRGFGFPSDVSIDNVLIFISEMDLWRANTVGESVEEPWLATPANERNATFSPNGEWVAYDSDETGRFETYLRRLDGIGGEQPVSNGGGEQPSWSTDGRTLYYRTVEGLQAVAFDAGTTPSRLGSPRFITPLAGGDFSGQRSYDPTPGGGFIATEPDTGTSTFRITYNLSSSLR